MFLGLDIGNTNTTVGAYKAGSVIPSKTYNLPTIKDVSLKRLVKEIENFIYHEMSIGENIDGIAFSSVVPEINSLYQKALLSVFNIDPYIITHDSKLNITLKYYEPNELGIDRIVNAEAAFNEYKGNKIIIDKP